MSTVKGSQRQQDIWNQRNQLFYSVHIIWDYADSLIVNCSLQTNILTAISGEKFCFSQKQWI